MAILLAKNGTIPPKQWNHNPKLQNNKNETVAFYLSKNNIEVP